MLPPSDDAVSSPRPPSGPLVNETPAPVVPDPKPPQQNAPAGSRLERAARWIALAANIGVVLGLILVIVEVRQNAELTRTQMEQRKNDFLAEIEFSLANRESAEVWVKAIRTPESLTDAEMKIVEAHLLSVMLQWDHLFQMERGGLVTRAHVRQHIANSAPYYFGSRFGKHWWRLQMPGWQGTAMNEVAGPIVEALNDTFLAEQFEKMRIASPPQPESAERPRTP
jgi:hypothetical protein